MLTIHDCTFDFEANDWPPAHLHLANRMLLATVMEVLVMTSEEVRHLHESRLARSAMERRCADGIRLLISRLPPPAPPKAGSGKALRMAAAKRKEEEDAKNGIVRKVKTPTINIIAVKDQ
jgi:hypothetical protein